jgi:hypothetical protein
MLAATAQVFTNYSLFSAACRKSLMESTNKGSMLNENGENRAIAGKVIKLK